MPSSLQIRQLSRADLSSLLLDQRLPLKFGPFSASQTYIFLYRDRVYHTWQYLSKKGRWAHFKQICSGDFYFFRPTALKKSAPGTKELNLIKGLYRQEISELSEVSLKLSNRAGQYQLSWHCLSRAELLGHSSIRISSDLKKAVTELSSLKSAVNKSLLNRIRTRGKFIFNHLFDLDLKKLLSRKCLIHCRNESDIPLAALYDGTGFLGLQHILTDHRLPAELHSTVAPQFISLVKSAWQSDEYMSKEFDALTRLFSAFEDIPTRSLAHTGGKAEICETFENSSVLHYIGHGLAEKRKTGLILDDGSLFKTSDLIKLTSAPRLLVLSCCRGINDSFIKAFFARGGAAIIHCRSDLISEPASEIFKSFYWQMLNKGQSVGNALVSVKNKLASKNSDWLNIELAGDPQLRLR